MLPSWPNEAICNFGFRRNLWSRVFIRVFFLGSKPENHGNMVILLRTWGISQENHFRRKLNTWVVWHRKEAPHTQFNTLTPRSARCWSFSGVWVPIQSQSGLYLLELSIIWDFRTRYIWRNRPERYCHHYRTWYFLGWSLYALQSWFRLPGAAWWRYAWSHPPRTRRLCPFGRINPLSYLQIWFKNVFPFL